MLVGISSRRWPKAESNMRVLNRTLGVVVSLFFLPAAVYAQASIAGTAKDASEG